MRIAWTGIVKLQRTPTGRVTVYDRLRSYMKSKKYSDEELMEMFQGSDKPVYWHAQITPDEQLILLQAAPVQQW